MKRLSLTIKIIGVILLVSVAGVIIGARQFGSQALSWDGFPLAKIAFDPDGIPTLEGKDWDSVIQAEGYVVASDRLWQMDLMRRSAAGRLSEWFGPKPEAIKWDSKRRREDWQGVAERAVAQLPSDQKRICESYAAGVNRFIEEHPRRVGVEYRLLGTKPEPWACVDTLLILLAMTEDLTASFEKDILRTKWNQRLDSDWQKFLFPQAHPWDVAMIGKIANGFPSLPLSKSLPLKPLSEKERMSRLEKLDGPEVEIGSNNWLWRGGGNYFLANDPHLAFSVPQLWYQIRLRVSKEDWIVGASLPGLPGVVLGRNRFLSWGFTNLWQDVDDLLEEKISEDGRKYADGKRWLPIETKHFTIKIKGAAEVEGEAKFTSRGPLQRYIEGDSKYYSRQWIAFKPGILFIPSLALNRAMDWTTFNLALDHMKVPAQNVIYMDNVGNMGYRATGLQPKRKTTGMWIQPASQGEWLGFEPVSTRPRLYLPVDYKNPKATAHLQTANQIIFPTPFPQYSSSPLREERIRTFLEASPSYQREDMEGLQRDTYSRFHKELLNWIVTHATSNTDGAKGIVEKWGQWDGFITHGPEVFSDALLAEELLRDRLLSRVREKFFPPEERNISYRYFRENAWMLAVIEKPNGSRVFGLEDNDLAQSLLDAVTAKDRGRPKYPDSNYWIAQHPLSRVPILGYLFKVKEFPMWGHREVVRVEQPQFGAGIRMVWDMGNPTNSTWQTPVGQSGHILTAHYSDFQKNWINDKPIKVFPSQYDWGFK